MEADREERRSEMGANRPLRKVAPTRWARLRRFGIRKKRQDVDRALQCMVQWAYKTVPAYRSLYDAAQSQPETFRGLIDLPSLPIVDREAFAIDTPIEDRVCRSADLTKLVSRLTSGTQGLPTRVLMSRTEALFRRLLIVRAWRYAVSVRLPLTVIDVGIREDPHAEPEISWHGAIRLVRVPLLRLGETDIRFLARFRRAILAGYPSSLSLLADHLEEQSGDLSLRIVATRGEVLHARMRQRLERFFGCRVVDYYNCEEIGNMAWQCPADPSTMHVNTDACVLEIVDDAGDPVPLGEEGRILVTNLYNRTMPFIRYDLCDRGALLSNHGEPCACGSRQPRIGLVEGRDDDCLILTNGTRLSPRVVATVVEQTAVGLHPDSTWSAPFRQYRVVQDAVDHITVCVAPVSEPDPALESAVADAFRRIDPDMICSVTWVDGLPTARSGKFRKIMRLLSV